MCITAIPFFKEIIVMAFACDNCGNKSSEVKVGGAMSELGRKITVTVNDIEMLKRDLFKSDTCEVKIPEINFECTSSTLGGVYTTVEGLISRLKENFEKNNPFAGGDSS